MSKYSKYNGIVLFLQNIYLQIIVKKVDFQIFKSPKQHNKKKKRIVI